MTTASSRQVRTYGGWQKPSSFGLLGLSFTATAVGVGGIALAIFTMIFSPPAGLAVMAGTVVLLAPFSVKIGGRTAARWAAVRWMFSRGKRQRHTSYRSGPLSMIDGGQHRLPGVLAATQMHEAQDAYGRPFGMLQYPFTGQFAAMLRAEADGAALVDADQVDQWVAGWASWLSRLSQESPQLDAASVTVETAPDSGQRLAREVDRLTDPQAPEFARRVLAETAEQYPHAAAAVTTRLALVYNNAGPNGRRDASEMAVEIGTQLPNMWEALATTGAGGAGPMSARQLVDTAHTAYHPAAAIDVEAAQGEGGAELGWHEVGPAAAEERWDHYQHDEACSVTWAMEEAPRGNVLSNVLAQLVAPNRELPRKRVTLMYRPHNPGDAARIVDADLRTAVSQASSGSRERAHQSQAVRTAELAAGEEAAGAGVIRFSVLVTVTVTNTEQLRRAESVVASLATAARLRLRKTYGQQAAAFAAGLGVGVVLPDHATIPQARMPGTVR